MVGGWGGNLASCYLTHNQEPALLSPGRQGQQNQFLPSSGQNLEVTGSCCPKSLCLINHLSVQRTGWTQVHQSLRNGLEEDPHLKASFKTCIFFGEPVAMLEVGMAVPCQGGAASIPTGQG